MQQKICPKCKAVTGIHTRQCGCGHAFRTQFNAAGQPKSSGRKLLIPFLAGSAVLAFLILGSGLAFRNFQKSQSDSRPEWQRAIEDSPKRNSIALDQNTEHPPARRGNYILRRTLMLPRGFDVPMATKDPRDLELWMNTVPASGNGVPHGVGDARTRNELVLQRRIITFPSLTPVDIIENDSGLNGAKKVRIKSSNSFPYSNINAGQEGYVYANMAVDADNPPPMDFL